MLAEGSEDSERLSEVSATEGEDASGGTSEEEVTAEAEETSEEQEEESETEILLNRR